MDNKTLQQPPAHPTTTTITHRRTLCVAQKFNVAKAKPWRFNLLVYILEHEKVFAGSTFIRHRDLKSTNSFKKERCYSAFFTSGNLDHLTLLGAKACGSNINLGASEDLFASQKHCNCLHIPQIYRFILLGGLCKQSRINLFF